MARVKHPAGVEQSQAAPGEPSGRERLLVTARQLFRRHGASNVGINDVTAAAGVARMTLYNNFPSKEALTVAVYEEMARAALQSLRELGTSRRSEERKIWAIFDHFARGDVAADYRGCPLIHASLQAPEPAGPIYAIVQAYKRALREHLFNVLDEGRSNRGELADQLVLLLDGAVTEAYLQGVTQPMAAAKHAAATLLRASA
jgi:AcrR family transcriptional regulator